MKHNLPGRSLAPFALPLRPAMASVFLAVISLIFAGSARAAQVQGEPVQLWPVVPLVKVFRDAVPGAMKAAVAEAARGEHASFQIVLKAESPISRLRAHVSPFTPALGRGTLAPRAPRFVGYVPVDRPMQTPPKDRLCPPPADYPDPLLELESIDVGAGKAQPIGITVAMPTNVVPGTYHGTLILGGTAGGARFDVEQKLQLVVHPAVAGPAHLWVTEWYAMQWRHMQITPEPESEPYYALLRRYARNMADHRHNVALISPLALTRFFAAPSGALQMDFTRFDRWVKIFQEEGVIGRIEGGHIGGRKGGWESEFVVTVRSTQDDRVIQSQADPDSPEADAFYHFHSV